MFTFKTNEEYEAEQAALLEESAQSIDAEESELMNEDPAYRLINLALELIDEGNTVAATVLCNRALDILEEEGGISEKDAKFLVNDEKEAITGYNKVIGRVTDPNDKQTLEHIRDEEKEHIEEIEGLLKGEHSDQEDADEEPDIPEDKD